MDLEKRINKLFSFFYGSIFLLPLLLEKMTVHGFCGCGGTEGAHVDTKSSNILFEKFARKFANNLIYKGKKF